MTETNAFHNCRHFIRCMILQVLIINAEKGSHTKVRALNFEATLSSTWQCKHLLNTDHCDI